jgi:hypothetical protein
MQLSGEAHWLLSQQLPSTQEPLQHTSPGHCALVLHATRGAGTSSFTNWSTCVSGRWASKSAGHSPS